MGTKQTAIKNGRKQVKEYLGDFYINHQGIYDEIFEIIDASGINVREMYEKFLPTKVKIYFEKDIWCLKTRVRRYIKLRQTNNIRKMHQSVYFYILMFGKEGRKKHKEYQKLQGYTNTFEYKQKKYNISKEEFYEYNFSRAITKENMERKYGKEKGKEVFENYCLKQSTTKSKEYQNEKYGEGTYEKACKNKSHSYDTYLERYGSEELAIKKLEEYFNKAVRSSKSYSNMSQKLFWKIYEKIQTKYKKIYFAELNTEFGKFNTITKSYNFYDFVILEKKLIIEFNGDLYHANPLYYKQDDIPKFRGNKITSKQIWEMDMNKVQNAVDLGFTVITIWENDLLKNGIDYIVSNILEVL